MESSEQQRKVSDEQLSSSSCSKELTKSSCPRPRLFYNCGRSLLTVTHYFCGKAKELPFPLGRLAASTEHTVGSWIQPVVESVEGLGLNLLSMADYQLSLIGSVAATIVPPVSAVLEKAQELEELSVKMPDMVITTVDKAVDMLSARGVTGSVADLWVKYEADLNRQTERVLRMTENVPLLSSITILVNVTVSPCAEMLSNWMLKHSEAEVKEVFSDESPVKDVFDDLRNDSSSTMEGSSNNQFPEKTESLAENHDTNEEQHSGKVLQQDMDKISEEDIEEKGQPVPIKVEASPDPILELFDTSWHRSSSIAGLSPKKKDKKTSKTDK